MSNEYPSDGGIKLYPGDSTFDEFVILMAYFYQNGLKVMRIEPCP